MSLTDNEIVKALECCNSEKESLCFECPYHLCSPACLTRRNTDIIDLINRLQVEKEALIAGQETLQKALAEKNEEIERLKEYEDIRPTGCPNCHRGNFSNSKFCSHCGTQLQGKKKDVRTEAIKEFAERLKGLLSLDIKVSNEDYYWITSDIDNLVKEMVGDTE